MVKGVAESHDFAVSQAPISYDDLQAAYSRLCDGKKAVECFDAKEGDKRQRRFMHFIREAKITEYTQTGYALDTKTLLPTGKVYERDVNYIQSSIPTNIPNCNTCIGWQNIETSCNLYICIPT